MASQVEKKLTKDLLKLQRLMSPFLEFVKKESSSFFRSIRTHVKETRLMVIPHGSNYTLLWEANVYFSRAFGLFKHKVYNIQVRLETIINKKYGFESARIATKYSPKLGLYGAYVVPDGQRKQKIEIYYNKKIQAEMRRYINTISREFKIPLEKVKLFFPPGG